MYKKLAKPWRGYWHSCMLFFLCLYIAILIIGCAILLQSVMKIEMENELETVKRLYPHYDRLSHPEQTHLKTFGWPNKKVSLPFECPWLSETSNFVFLTSGWTKSVYKFMRQNESFALKTINVNGEDIRRCTQNDLFQNCHEKASSKLLKEFILLRELQHPNLVKVLGWCMDEDKVAMVLELCSPLNTLILLRMSFLQRLKISADLARLMYFLSSTHLGPIALNDFRREQFVLCGDVLKLADLDDASIEEPGCRSSQDCTAGWCSRGMCKGHNDSQNVRHMFSQFFSLTLAFDTPQFLLMDLTALLVGPKQWNSLYVLKLIEKIHDKFCKVNRHCM